MSSVLADITGPDALSDWLNRRDLSQREMARRLGIHWTMVNKILMRTCRPGLTLALRIERHTGIPVREWDATQVDKRGQTPTRAARKPK